MASENIHGTGSTIILTNKGGNHHNHKVWAKKERVLNANAGSRQMSPTKQRQTTWHTSAKLFTDTHPETTKILTKFNIIANKHNIQRNWSKGASCRYCKIKVSQWLLYYYKLWNKYSLCTSAKKKKRWDSASPGARDHCMLTTQREEQGFSNNRLTGNYKLRKHKNIDRRVRTLHNKNQ